MKVKVHGAGSIGNHLSHASRSLGWAVDLCDIDPAALARTKAQIFPMRYGKWDEGIRLLESRDAPKGGYDLIVIGTPPDSHMALARAAVAEKPRAILIEKPLCGPDLQGAQNLVDEAAAAGVAVFVGYDHVVGRACGLVGDALRAGVAGAIVTIDVEFREHWGGICWRIPGSRGLATATWLIRSAAVAPPANIRTRPTCGSILRISVAAGASRSCRLRWISSATARWTTIVFA